MRRPMIKLTITHNRDTTELSVRTGDGEPVPIRTLLNIISEVESGLLAIAVPAQPLRDGSAPADGPIDNRKEVPTDSK
jgi:hypothetical protein